MKPFVANFAFKVRFDACAHYNQITVGFESRVDERSNDRLRREGLVIFAQSFQHGLRKILNDSHVVLLPTNKMSSSASAKTEIMLITSFSLGLPGGPDISRM